MRNSLSVMFRVGSGLAVAALALVIVARPTVAAAGDDAAAGQALFKSKCAACHTVDTNRLGPKIQGVVGRPVASAAGYTYSPALKKLGGVWTPTRIDQFLSAPQKMAPGSKMYLQVGDAKQRQQIAAYLQSVSTK
jgi:cytochrome c